MTDNSTYTSEQKIAFTKSLYCPARQCADESGCSWELILAQAAGETGWGEKILPGTNNIFNIKASPDWHGESKVFNVWEKVHGEKVWVNAPFRVYPSILESLRDRQQFLKDNPRYAKSGLYDDDVKGDLVKEAQALQRGGYATDEQYAHKLKKVFDGKTMQHAISAAQKDGCKGCLPTINVYVLDAAKVKLANTKVRATQESKTCELVTDENGHVQVQAALSAGQIVLQVWSAQTSKWVSIDEKITPTTPATVVTVIAPFLIIPTSTALHQPPPSTSGSKPGTSGTPKPATSANSHQDGFERYTIKKGDTLGKIAKSHSTSYVTLAHLNHISSPYVIRPGQELKVPKAKQAAGSSSNSLLTAPTAPTSQGNHPTNTPTGTASSASPVTSSAGHPHPSAPVQPRNGVHVARSTNATDNPQTEVLNPRRAPWMAIAEQEFQAHIKRNGGIVSDDHIKAYFNETSYKSANVHSTPYCAAFVNWCLARAGFPGNNSAGAESLSTWGRATRGNKPAYGAVAVVHIPPHNSPHVTFVSGAHRVDSDGKILQIATLGGNQGHAHEVSCSSLPESWVVHYRFPSNYVESDDDYDLHLVVVDGAQMTAASTH
jgi:uncharacterized protein (TIGR02594 family)